jgi:hypothetical protein
MSNQFLLNQIVVQLSGLSDRDLSKLLAVIKLYQSENILCRRIILNIPKLDIGELAYLAEKMVECQVEREDAAIVDSVV